MVERYLAKVEVVGSNPTTRFKICGSNSMVECHPSKVIVASSSLVSRSILCTRSSVGQNPGFLIRMSQIRVLPGVFVFAAII